MKIIVATVALATLMTSPVLAQSARRQAAEPPAYQSGGQSWQGADRAYSRRQVGRSSEYRSSNPRYDVYDTSGRYLGSDPDPLIRSELSRVPSGSRQTDP